MDHGSNQQLESRRSSSFSRLNHNSSSRRNSFVLNNHEELDESESASEAGDIGDRALHSSRFSISSRSRFSLDHTAAVENGTVVPIQDSEIARSDSRKIDEEEKIHWLLEYVACLLSLAVFGILGVLLRYSMQKLFGPELIGATSDSSYMYLDLPSNMVGSFLMGWLGVVFKGDIMKISEQLAIGLTTGFLGSLTTFSGWNQKMLELSVKGQWVFTVLGIFIGLFLVAYSIIFGIETAKGFKFLAVKKSNEKEARCCNNSYYLVKCMLLCFAALLAMLWALFAFLEVKEFKDGGSGAQLFLACLVGPFGVWVRWVLARFNGRGLGKNGSLKWFPFGTFAANVLAASLMAALATLKRAVKTEACNVVASGIQLGFLGCLSTVSTFIAEFHAMRESLHPWRAYAYASATFFASFALGTLIFSVPVWALDYN